MTQFKKNPLKLYITSLCKKIDSKFPLTFRATKHGAEERGRSESKAVLSVLHGPQQHDRAAWCETLARRAD